MEISFESMDTSLDKTGEPGYLAKQAVVCARIFAQALSEFMQAKNALQAGTAAEARVNTK